MILKAISLTILGIVIILLLTDVINVKVTNEETAKQTNLNPGIILIISLICGFIIQL